MFFTRSSLEMYFACLSPPLAMTSSRTAERGRVRPLCQKSPETRAKPRIHAGLLSRGLLRGLTSHRVITFCVINSIVWTECFRRVALFITTGNTGGEVRRRVAFSERCRLGSWRAARRSGRVRLGLGVEGTVHEPSFLVTLQPVPNLRI